MLEIKGISKNYGSTKALIDFTAVFNPGIYGLLGPNGAGKTTLMDIIARNLKADKGHIFYNGKDIEILGRTYRETLGYMPQQQRLYDSFTGRRFLYYMATLKGMKNTDATKQIEGLLDLVNLRDVADKRLSTYSGGMRQRILIAQAILADPQVLILDEPTAGLDPKERIRIRNLISEISFRKIVILATHVVSDVEYISREILLMNKGRLVSKKPLSEHLADMEGKVYEIIEPEDTIDNIKKEYKVVSIVKKEHEVAVRLVSDSPPSEYNYRRLDPILEDVYLYRFDDRDVSL
ncbi:MAG: ABC transporter ATP-binding protein [Clostridiales bacterium]|nr:ABC transporter ATP-binding protein [Clostridiales bacterium]